MTSITARRFICLSIVIFYSFCAASCTDNNKQSWQGYVEGEFVYIASPLGGKLEYLAVNDGQKVSKGELLFSLENSYEKAGVDEAEKNLEKMLNNLSNLKNGARPSEVDAIKARLNSARAELRLAESELKRRKQLYDADIATKEEIDKYSAVYKQAVYLVKQISSELTTATIGAREDEIKAAESAVEAARAKLEQAKWNFEQKVQYSPCIGLVVDTIHRPGEWVNAGRPVISILPPENRKVRFYVPEKIMGSLKIGEDVFIRYDGRKDPVSAKISYISPQAEYTPPVIYSSQSREKLVYLLEAKTSSADALLLHPGQPVDVSLN